MANYYHHLADDNFVFFPITSVLNTKNIGLTACQPFLFVYILNLSLKKTPQ